MMYNTVREDGISSILPAWQLRLDANPYGHVGTAPNATTQFDEAKLLQLRLVTKILGGSKVLRFIPGGHVDSPPHGKDREMQ